VTRSALVGHTGFVGSNLQAQLAFDATFNSTNIDEIAGGRFDLLVFAGAQSRKWWANAHPREDWGSIRRALKALARVESAYAILISTIDVVPPGAEKTEMAEYRTVDHHAYGANRLALEREFNRLFPNCLIVRLPGLFGPGLKKNIIFDLLTENLLSKINLDSKFQYYDLKRLSCDIETAREAGLDLVHLVTEPVSTADIVDRYFDDSTVGDEPAPAVCYDYRTLHANHFGGSGGYIEDRETVMKRLDRFIAEWRDGGGRHVDAEARRPETHG